MEIGVVGALGYQGKKIVEELHSLGVEVVKCDTKFRRRQSGMWIKDYRELYVENVDGVVVAAPNAVHFDIAQYFIHRKISVLVEKPITTRLVTAEVLLELAKEKDVVLATGSVFSFNNSAKTVKEIIEAGLLGKLEFVQCSWCNKMEPWGEKDILLDLAPHPFDVLCSWNLEPKEYSSYTSMNGRHKLVFTEAEGVEIEMKLSWVEGPKMRCVKIVGEEFILVVDVLNQDVFVYEGNEVIAERVDDAILCRRGGFDEYLGFEKNNTLRDELKDFLKQIEEGPKYRLAEQAVKFLKWKQGGCEVR